MWAGGVAGGDLRPVDGRRTVLGDDVEQAGDADVLLGGDAEDRDELAGLECAVHTGAELVLAEGAALVEELGHRGVVALGDELDDLFVQLLHLLGERLVQTPA